MDRDINDHSHQAEACCDASSLTIMTCQQEPYKRLFAPEKISLIQLHLQFNQSFFHRNEEFIQSKTSSLLMLLRLYCCQLDLPSPFFFQWTFRTSSNWCRSCHRVLRCPPHQLPGSPCPRLPSSSGFSSWCRHTDPGSSCTTSSSHPDCHSTCSPTPTQASTSAQPPALPPSDSGEYLDYYQKCLQLVNSEGISRTSL